MARPFGTLKYDNIEDLQRGIDKYFNDCEANNKPYTMYGLANALNITRNTLLNYSKSNYSEVSKDYFEPISRARQKCKEYAETRLFDKDGANGAKFSLINNAKEDGWSDRQDISLDASAMVQFVEMLPEDDAE